MVGVFGLFVGEEEDSATEEVRRLEDWLAAMWKEPPSVLGSLLSVVLATVAVVFAQEFPFVVEKATVFVQVSLSVVATFLVLDFLFVEE